MSIKIKRRIKTFSTVVSLAISMVVLEASAENFPSRSLTLLVPFTAGGATDVLARTLADGLSKDLKHAVVVVNAPGAGGSIGQARAARAPADGYTLLLGNVGTLAANASLYKDLSYNILKDFTALASVGDAPQVLSVRSGLPVKSFDEFAAYAKRNQSTMNFGTAGVGSGSFLGGILLNASIGAKITPVHYRGAAQATADVMAGHIDYRAFSEQGVLPCRRLAHFSRRRTG